MNYAVCLCCATILTSRHRHDYATCHCDNHTFIDGGADYCRYGGKDMAKIAIVTSLAAANRLRDEVAITNSRKP